MPAIAAIVVTFNRKALLTHCLQALLAQSAPLWRIVVIDNASTDGTETALRQAGLLDQPIIHYTRLPENIGGAGGFAHGMQLAFDAGAEWFWLMDDDAMAEREALAALLALAPQPEHVYGSSAVFREGKYHMMRWPTVITVYNGDWPVVIRNHALLPSLLFRTMVTLAAEKNPWAQLTTTLRGLRDGFLGRLEAARSS